MANDSTGRPVSRRTVLRSSAFATGSLALGGAATAGTAAGLLGRAAGGTGYMSTGSYRAFTGETEIECVDARGWGETFYVQDPGETPKLDTTIEVPPNCHRETPTRTLEGYVIRACEEIDCDVPTFGGDNGECCTKLWVEGDADVEFDVAYRITNVHGSPCHEDVPLDRNYAGGDDDEISVVRVAFGPVPPG